MNLDWNSLGFSYIPTRCHVRYTWRDGVWDDGVVEEDPHISLHIAATVLHYGQAAFEGLKAFSCKDGAVQIFRCDENAKRMNRSAERILMADVPPTLFREAVHRAVRENIKYVPPYGTGGALYIRPFLFGSGPQIGVNPAKEYTFIVMVVPVGDYYKGGLTPVTAVVLDGYDRAAPQGVGHVKVAGNYAASLQPGAIAREQGYPINLYLDSRENRYIDEFGTSNFIGITKDGSYVTPDSACALPSITNMTLMELAAREGLPVLRRPIAFDEVADFAEIGACGTAVVITPVNRIVRGEQVITIGPETGCGPVLQKLYQRVRAIQVGEEEAPAGWTDVVQL